MKLLKYLIVALLLALPASAQIMPLAGAGLGAPTVVASNNGMGDLIASHWIGYWGLRCFKKTGTGAIADVFDGSDAHETSLVCDGNGNVTSAANGTGANCGSSCYPIATYCSGAGCTIKTFYDQSGASSCTGGTCDLTQATISLRAAYTPSCYGSLPCGTLNNTSSQGYISAGTMAAGYSVPYTFFAAAKRTAGATEGDILNTPYFSGFFDSSANHVGFYALSSATVVANDGTTYAMMMLSASGSTSKIQIDGNAPTTGLSGGGGQISSGYNVKTFGQVLSNRTMSGTILEWGELSDDESTNFNAISSNIHTYWGF